MKKVFVTGASGFIGRRLINALKVKKLSISVLSRSNIVGIDTVICDLKTDSVPKSALNGVDTIFHLAGFSHDLRNAKKNKNLYQRINVDATIELIDKAIESNVKKFIFISSVKAGGMPNTGECMSEFDQRDPQGIYGKTKREAELKLQEKILHSKIHISIIRPSLVYGPDLKGNLQLMLKGIKSGWFPPIPETENRRSMIHVDDLVRAIIMIAEINHNNGEIFIATNDEPYSSREIYESMCDSLGKTVPRWAVPRLFFDILSYISPTLKYKFDKLLGDEHYSSKKINSLGFKSELSIGNINETTF